MSKTGSENRGWGDPGRTHPPALRAGAQGDRAVPVGAQRVCVVLVWSEAAPARWDARPRPRGPWRRQGPLPGRPCPRAATVQSRAAAGRQPWAKAVLRKVKTLLPTPCSANPSPLPPRGKLTRLSVYLTGSDRNGLDFSRQVRTFGRKPLFCPSGGPFLLCQGWEIQRPRLRVFVQRLAPFRTGRGLRRASASIPHPQPSPQNRGVLPTGPSRRCLGPEPTTTALRLSAELSLGRRCSRGPAARRGTHGRPEGGGLGPPGTPDSQEEDGGQNGEQNTRALRSVRPGAEGRCGCQSIERVSGRGAVHGRAGCRVGGCVTRRSGGGTGLPRPGGRLMGSVGGRQSGGFAGGGALSPGRQEAEETE